MSARGWIVRGSLGAVCIIGALEREWGAVLLIIAMWGFGEALSS